MSTLSIALSAVITDSSLVKVYFPSAPSKVVQVALGGVRYFAAIQLGDVMPQSMNRCVVQVAFWGLGE